MVWNRIDQVDGKPRYIKREGSIYFLTRDKSRATEDRIPEGWEVKKLSSGHLTLRPIRD